MSELAGASSPLAVIASGTELPDGDEPPSPRPSTHLDATSRLGRRPRPRVADWRWQAQNAVRHAGSSPACSRSRPRNARRSTG